MYDKYLVGLLLFGFLIFLKFKILFVVHFLFGFSFKIKIKLKYIFLFETYFENRLQMFGRSC